MPFVEKKSDVDRSTLYSFGGPFELLHADIADIIGSRPALLSAVCRFVYTKSLYLSNEKKTSSLKKDGDLLSGSRKQKKKQKHEASNQPQISAE